MTVLSPLIKTHLGPGCPAILSGTSPADDELASCFPRRRRHAGLALFMQAPLLSLAGPIAAVSAPPAVPIAAAPASPPVQHCRILNEAASTAVRAMHLLPFVKEHAVGKTEPRAKSVCKFAAARVNATAIDFGIDIYQAQFGIKPYLIGNQLILGRGLNHKSIGFTLYRAGCCL